MINIWLRLGVNEGGFFCTGNFRLQVVVNKR